MAIKLKIIKKKEFKAKEESHIHYTCAYKGRVFGVNTLRIKKEDIEVKGKVLTLTGDVEVTKHTSTDPVTKQVKVFLDIVPKIDLDLAEF